MEKEHSEGTEFDGINARQIASGASTGEIP
jgi:hypothetical protein